MTPNECKDFIKEVFKNTIENPESNDDTYAHYFSTEYIQYVDGKTLTYSDFIAHTRKLKEVMASVKITFKHILADKDKVATVHLVKGIKKDGNLIQAQVNAVFQIKDKKITLCDELTYLIKGEETDKDLGSR